MLEPYLVKMMSLMKHPVFFGVWRSRSLRIGYSIYSLGPFDNLIYARRHECYQLSPLGQGLTVSFKCSCKSRRC